MVCWCCFLFAAPWLVEGYGGVVLFVGGSGKSGYEWYISSNVGGVKGEKGE